jgi:hypothetical protein
VGKARVLIPAEFVEGVVEVKLSPSPPLARKWVGGLGVHSGRALLCVSLLPGAPATSPSPQRTVKGVLFKVVESELVWALEVNAVRAFQSVRKLERRPAPLGSTVPSWIGVAADSAGQTLGWVDVTSMVKELAGSA